MRQGAAVRLAVDLLARGRCVFDADRPGVAVCRADDRLADRLTDELAHKVTNCLSVCFADGESVGDSIVGVAVGVADAESLDFTVDVAIGIEIVVEPDGDSVSLTDRVPHRRLVVDAHRGGGCNVPRGGGWDARRGSRRRGTTMPSLCRLRRPQAVRDEHSAPIFSLLVTVGGRP